MTDTPESDMIAASPTESWLERLDRLGEEAGYFQTLGPKHWAFFADEGTTLLVTFESAAAIRAGKDGLPQGLAIAKTRGWSHLCLIAEGATWYRDPGVWGYFDRLVDDAFFEDFDRVLFYGAGPCGYAAAAYSVTAPGASVLLMAPRATQDPSFAGWDRREPAARRMDFTSRYGYAPAMTEGAGHVFVIYDPSEPMDAMHAALFRAPHVTFFRTPALGPAPERMFDSMGLTPRLIEAAMAGDLTRAAFARFWRLRRNSGVYARLLMDKLAARGNTARELRVTRWVAGHFKSAGFQKRLAPLEAKLAPPA